MSTEGVEVGRELRVQNIKMKDATNITVINDNDEDVVEFRNSDKRTKFNGAVEFTGTVTGLNLTKDSVGLGNVDNTSNVNKPVSAATQIALDNRVTET